MLGSSTWLLLIGAAQVLDEPIYLHTGETFCHHVNCFFVASTTYGFFFGGFGIAMMRMMFVQFPSRIPIGQVSTALTIGTNSHTTQWRKHGSRVLRALGHGVGN